MTEGEYRVGIDFNPSGNEVVNELKATAAKFIDLCRAVQNTTTVDEARRCASIAMTEAESAAMWAVKAATKQPTA